MYISFLSSKGGYPENMSRKEVIHSHFAGRGGGFSHGQKFFLVLVCAGAVISLFNIFMSGSPDAAALHREDAYVGSEENLKNDFEITESLLEMNHIIPDLAAQSGASGWGTNVPSYLFGLARGSGNGESAVGLVLGDLEGNHLSGLAADCAKIFWTDHDGQSFGSEEIQLKEDSTTGYNRVKIDFIKTTDSEGEEIYVKVSNAGGNKLVIVFLEEMGTVTAGGNDGKNNFIQFENPSDKTQWVLAANMDAAHPLTLISGMSSDSQQNVWKPPVEILQRVRDAERTRSSGIFTPRAPVLSFGDVQSSAFLVFKPLSDSLVLRISKTQRKISHVEFPLSDFEQKIRDFRGKFSEFQRKSISNLLGNLGRFSGELQVNNRDHIVDVFTTKLTMTSISPSRTTFPRPFLWDEGFHLLAVDDVNHPLAVEILTTWLRAQITSEEQGWIPRELALSERDKARIPVQFLAQSPLIANPPTLLFVIRKWLFQRGPFRGLEKIGAHVARWYRHLEKTQRSSPRRGSSCYRWKSRDSNLCLASGMDDYPRGLIVNDDECHLDLHVWLMLMTDTLAKICQHLESSGPSYCKGNIDWRQKHKNLGSNMWEIFKATAGPDDDSQVLLADFLGEQQVAQSSPYDTTLLQVPPWSQDMRCGAPPFAGQCPPNAPCCSPFNWCGDDAAHCACPQCKHHSSLPLKKRFVEGYTVKPVHSPHLGYVNLFPMMMGQLCVSNPRDRSHLAYVTRTILSHEGLMSEFGVISLSRKDPLFQTGNNYWRGNIWANINLLVAGSLMAYSEALRGIVAPLSREMQDKANDVKKKWVAYMKQAWETAEGPREFLNPLTGEGGGVYPFAGWTAATMALLSSDDTNWHTFWTQSVGIATEC